MYKKTILSLLCLSITFHSYASEIKKRVLLGSPISKKPAILKNFLDGLYYTKKQTFSLDYIFIDDNAIAQSSELIQSFGKKVETCSIIKSWVKIKPQTDHSWPLTVIHKVAEFKDFIIKEAINGNYDYLFLVDSDLILHPNTIQHLISCDKDIISEIFWTSNTPNGSEKWCNVWCSDVHNCPTTFTAQLKYPGIYLVGGLGACTLINKHALSLDIKFKQMKNLSFWGEDRHFCVRAIALGLKLYVDTHYPAYHMYFDSDIIHAEQFKRKMLSCV